MIKIKVLNANKEGISEDLSSGRGRGAEALLKGMERPDASCLFKGVGVAACRQQIE